MFVYAPALFSPTPLLIPLRGVEWMCCIYLRFRSSPPPVFRYPGVGLVHGSALVCSGVPCAGVYIARYTPQAGRCSKHDFRGILLLFAFRFVLVLCTVS